MLKVDKNTKERGTTMTSGVPKDGWTDERRKEHGERISKMWAEKRANGITRKGGKLCKKAREKHQARMKMYWKSRRQDSGFIKSVAKVLHPKSQWTFCPQCGKELA